MSSTKILVRRHFFIEQNPNTYVCIIFVNNIKSYNEKQDFIFSVFGNDANWFCSKQSLMARLFFV